MYSPQSANLATHRTPGLPTILGFIAAFALAVIALTALLVATKAQVGDHSRDAVEANRGAAFAIQGDRSLDAVEARRAALSDAKHKVAPVTIVAAPAKPNPDSWDSTRKEHVPGAAVVTAPIVTAPIVSSRESMESLRLEHRYNALTSAAAKKAALDNLMAYRRALAQAQANQVTNSWGGGR